MNRIVGLITPKVKILEEIRGLQLEGGHRRIDSLPESVGRSAALVYSLS